MPRWAPKAGVLGPGEQAVLRLSPDVPDGYEPIVFSRGVIIRLFDGRTARLENTGARTAAWVLVVAPRRVADVLSLPWGEIGHGFVSAIKSLKRG